MKVGILAGGRSQRDLSISTAEVIHTAITAQGHEVVMISIDRSGAWCAHGDRLCVWPGARLLDCDVVFPTLHGPYGENGAVQGLLELLNVPYVGAGVLASSLCTDKAALKDALAANGVPQLRYVVVHETWWRHAPRAVVGEIATLSLPVFVKPAHVGPSVGIAKVTDPARLQAALETAFSQDGVAVVEEFSSGIKVGCAVIGLTDPETSVPGQIVARDSGSCHDEPKHTCGGYCLTAPAQIPVPLSVEVRRLARETFLRLGCAGLARVDFLVEEDRVLVNEVNTLPGFAPTSDFPKLWAASGIGLPSLCDRLLGFALERFRNERRARVF